MIKIFAGIAIIVSILLVFSQNVEAGLIFFQPNPSSINAGQAVSFVWQASNSSGVKLILPCIRGITYASDSGASVTCASSITNLPTSGAYTVTILNIGSSSANIQAKLVNKDPGGTYEEDYPLYATVSVNPAPFVISEVTASPQEITGSGESTISWKHLYSTKVNFIISCIENVTVTHTLGVSSPLPCGSIALSTDQSANSSTKFTFSNSSDSTRIVTVSVLPAYGDGTYEASRSKSVDITLKPKPVAYPRVTLTTAPPAFLLSGSSTTIAWTGENISGVNLIIFCAPYVSATTTAVSGVLPCGTYAFQNNLTASGSLKLTFANSSFSTQSISIKLVPAPTATTYDASRSIEARFSVLYPGANPPTPITPTVPSVPPSTISVTKPSFTYTFKRALYYGLRNDSDVRALQEILTREKVYSGPITGNFFSLTLAGVKNFQKKYGIEQVGIVGPKTRAKLNELYSK